VSKLDRLGVALRATWDCPQFWAGWCFCGVLWCLADARKGAAYNWVLLAFNAVVCALNVWAVSHRREDAEAKKAAAELDWFTRGWRAAERHMMGETQTTKEPRRPS
jgi:hypothetical protein